MYLHFPGIKLQSLQYPMLDILVFSGVKYFLHLLHKTLYLIFATFLPKAVVNLNISYIKKIFITILIQRMSMANSGNIYVLDSYMPQSKTGLIHTLENITQDNFVVSRSSLLPVVSGVGREKLTPEKISYVIETINALGHLLSSHKSFTTL